MKKLLFSTVLLLSLTACRQDEKAVENLTDAKVSNLIKFKSVNPAKAHSQRIGLIIFEVTIARASQGCLTGLGFCKFIWFPGWKQAPDSGNILVEAVEENGVYKLKLPIDGELPADVSPADLTLTIDQSLIASIKSGAVEGDFEIAQGQYQFGTTVGDTGGYSFTLEEK